MNREQLPMHLRPNNLTMIDLLRHLPTLHDSLTPQPTESSSLLKDTLACFFLAAAALAGLLIIWAAH